MPLIRTQLWLTLALYLAACAAPKAAGQSNAIMPGEERHIASLGNTDLTVFTYRPEGCQPRLLLLVLHGVGREAAAYRAHAEPLAQRVCAIVVAPEFDRARFPEALYQYGGTARQPAGARTVDLVPSLIGWARQAANAPALPTVLLGHSAGAQFLSRVAAFVPTGAAGIILANPSTWVLPSTTTAAPFGLGGTEMATDDALRAYLALPVTALLGTADTGSKELTTSLSAMAQGPDRYTRGLNTFRMAQEVASRHGWPFGWTLAEVPGVGHNATAMFASVQAQDAVQRAVSNAH